MMECLQNDAQNKLVFCACAQPSYVDLVRREDLCVLTPDTKEKGLADQLWMLKGSLCIREGKSTSESGCAGRGHDKMLITGKLGLS